MTSERKTTSNQNNAKKSTGPRSERGRRHSSGNALRHGLAVAIGSDPHFNKDIDALAALLEHRGLPRELAHQMAEAEFDLVRIRQVRASKVNNICSDSVVNLSLFSGVDADLAKLDRYERRAHSRLKRVREQLR